MTTVYRGSILHSRDANSVEVLAPGCLWVAEDGKIEKITNADETRPSDLKGVQRFDFGDRFVLPGLVDAHVHIPQIDIIGIESEHLIDWLRDHIFEEEIANADPAIARDRAERCFQQMLRSGTTACAAFSSMHTAATDIAFVEAERAGIRAIIGKVLMNREAPAALLQDTDPALAETQQLIRRWGRHASGRLDVAITPRFGISCTDDLLDGAGRLASKHDCRVQTHLSENKGELQLIAKLFPNAPDYTAVYERTQLLRPGCLLAHCIHLSDDELTRIAARHAAAVYCPDSNFFLHSGRFPLARSLAHGVDIALGSDVGAGTSFSLFEAMKMGNYMQTQQVEPSLLLYLATLGGARALGWEDRIGNFAAGKDADFIVLDPQNMLRGRAVDDWDLREMLSILIHRGHSARIEAVFVRGRRLL